MTCFKGKELSLSKENGCSGLKESEKGAYVK